MLEGVVIRAVGNLYKVMIKDGKVFDCRIKGRLRILNIKSTNPVTVGDNVKFEVDSGSEIAGITEVLDRKNYIIRKSSNLSHQSHIIAANIDQVLLIITIKEPETNTDFIDRYLVAAESFKIPILIIINKIDLLLKQDDISKLCEFETIYNRIGYKTVRTSVKNDFNIDVIHDLICKKVSVISGNSGVGKSSLIKCLDPTLDLKIGTISNFHKSGRHTTSYSEMFYLNNGGYIIDTPGIKGFGLFDVKKEELSHYFPDIFEISKKCRFYNCTHIHEPDCAVICSVNDGSIAISRYRSYFNLFHDSDEKYR